MSEHDRGISAEHLPRSIDILFVESMSCFKLNEIKDLFVFPCMVGICVVLLSTTPPRRGSGRSRGRRRRRGAWGDPRARARGRSPRRSRRGACRPSWTCSGRRGSGNPGRLSRRRAVCPGRFVEVVQLVEERAGRLVPGDALVEAGEEDVPCPFIPLVVGHGDLRLRVVAVPARAKADGLADPVGQFLQYDFRCPTGCKRTN